MLIELILVGVAGMALVNGLLFTLVLLNKLQKKKRKKHADEIRAAFAIKVADHVAGVHGEIPLPAGKKETEILKDVLLEAFDRAEPKDREKLLNMARVSGIVMAELKELQSHQDSRKAIAAYTLGVMRAPEALESLLRVRTENRELTQCVARAIILISGTRYLSEVLKALGATALPQKAMALELLSLIEEDLYPKMSTYLKDTDVSKRILALEALGSRADERVYPFVVEELNSPDKEVRLAALKALMGLKGAARPEVREKIHILGQDPAWEVRAFTAKALGASPGVGYGAIHLLQKMLEDPNWMVRFNASESLLAQGEMGVVALAETLFSPDRFAKDRAWDVLSRELTLYDLNQRIAGFKTKDYILDKLQQFGQARKEMTILDA
ncbi:HEAT repeat domain-containing protein [Proteiniclasticum sp. BAD-10]|uniref:HEAT repeat domain-containing protein n=1 Tax=Proteiniclasticum sediminis TaxID=2804028 RepID=A0A941CR13_9CLOT|nr:HEAT repeat domain-containing protein [Proteiniclasticum sediminis]MBR0576049.1 HEAT repeat domain-containing protein [Proteiniclasticum sediminis]